MGTPSAEAGNKKEGRSIVTSPAVWYDNAPTLSHGGCAALKVVGLCPTPHKLFEKSLTKNFYLISLLATSAWALAINSATVMAPRSPSFLCRGEMVPLSASLSPTTSM